MCMHTSVTINPTVCSHTIGSSSLNGRVNFHSGIQCQRTRPTIDSVCGRCSCMNIDGSAVDSRNTTIADTITGVGHRLSGKSTAVDGDLCHTGGVAGRISGTYRTATIYSSCSSAIRRFRTVSTTIDCYLGTCYVATYLILINLSGCSSNTLVGHVAIIIICLYKPCFLVACTHF